MARKRARQINFRLDEAAYQRVQGLAKEKNQSAGSWLNEAVYEKLDRDRYKEVTLVNLKIIKQKDEVTAYLMPSAPAPSERGQYVGTIYPTEDGWCDVDGNKYSSPQEWLAKLGEERLD